MPEFIVKIIPGAQSGLAIIQQSIPVSPFLRPSVPFEKDHRTLLVFSDFHSDILHNLVIFFIYS